MPEERPDRSGEVATIQRGLVCDDWWPSGSCSHYAPSPPSHFYSCNGDTNAYPGEVVIFTKFQFQGYCFYMPVPPGGNIGVDFLGDMDRLSPEYHIKSYKTNLTRWGALYDGIWYEGAWYSVAPVENKPYFTTFDPSSLIFSN
jgi:hypothetical protein